MIVASEQMRNLIIDVTVAQGRDARDCLMVAGGGAAGLNIVRIARQIGLREILIPKLAAGLSAVGGLFTDVTAVFARGHYTLSTAFDYAGVNDAIAALHAEMDAFFASMPHAGEGHRRIECEARYDQQMWEIDVDLGPDGRFETAGDVKRLQEQFDANHLNLFAVNQPGSPIEAITWRGEARVVRRKPELDGDPRESVRAPSARPASTRQACFGGIPVTTPVFDGARLEPGDIIDGPAIIEEPTTTVVIIPGARATVRATHYLIDVGAEAATLAD